jgi:hypothetical protein
MSSKKGIIQYCFKGMKMSEEAGLVVQHDENILVVERNVDRQLFEFARAKTSWLLKGHSSTKSLLYGTQFILEC